MMRNRDAFALKGNLVYTPFPEQIVSLPGHYLVCEEGTVAGTFSVLPERFRDIPVEDCGNSLIIPGFVDLHMHAPQYAMRGLGMDLQLLEWLETTTFPEEARYGDLVYAEKAYRLFAGDLKKSSITRACIFATIHADATLMLMQLLEETGIVAAVGKVNMDVRCPDYYGETTAASIGETVRWIEACKDRFSRVSPILTPRFAPVCSAELMATLGNLQQKYGLPLQSHLSENIAEGQWVQSLFPDSRFYGEVYDRFGIFGSHGPTVMAHCVYSCPDEVALMKERGVFIAHCPQSNVNLASGIAPAKSYLDGHQRMGLGSDISGGFSLSGFRAISDAIQMSKMYWRLLDTNRKPLSLSEAFYLATKGGGEFFGKVGSFETGYEFDALVLDDSCWPTPANPDVVSRLERLVYLADERCIQRKYVSGMKIWDSGEGRQDIGAAKRGN